MESNVNDPKMQTVDLEKLVRANQGNAKISQKKSWEDKATDIGNSICDLILEHGGTIPIVDILHSIMIQLCNKSEVFNILDTVHITHKQGKFQMEVE